MTHQPPSHTQPLSHALPMRMMLLELRALRSEAAFLDSIATALFPADDPTRPTPPFPEDTATSLLGLLRSALHHQELCYAELDNAKQALHDALHPGHHAPAAHLAALEQRCAEADKPLKRVLHHLRGNAVTFSGGGIRSASFCLGILQGLARFSLRRQLADRLPAGASLLHDTQYLSTVSGGGYLGCWFSSWIARLAAPAGSHDARPLPQRTAEAYHATLQSLAGELPTTGADPAPEVIRHLREYTAYLAPQLGLSLDVWSLLAIAARNLLINWLMLVPLLLVMVAVPSFLLFGLGEFHTLLNQPVRLDHAIPNWLARFAADLPLYLALGTLVLASSIASGRALPSYRPWSGAPPPQQQASSSMRVFWRFVFPLLTVAFLLTARFSPLSASQRSPVADSMALAAIATLGFGVLGIFKWWTHYATYPGGRIAGSLPMRPVPAAALIFAVTVLLGAGTGIALELLGTALPSRLPALPALHLSPAFAPVLYNVLAPPLFTAVLLLGSTLFSALTQSLESEDDREWWARAGGMLLAAGTTWLASTAIVILGTAHFSAWQWAWPVSGGTVGLITSLIAKSSATPSGARPDQAPARRFSLRSLALPALAILSLALLALGLARLSDEFRHHLPTSFLARHPAVATLCLIALYAAVAAVVNRLSNLNVFSLHGLYRERLMRAFLGASNPARHPDPFIGFDSSDTLLMKDLPHTPGAPLHIVNGTLNLVGTRRAAWRQRKAESFTFSALAAGAWRLNYVPAHAYGGDHGVTVATAMAISGAAADPNMGYHSSPLVGLLMTVFNVRLGWWLPNPRFPRQRGYPPARQHSFLRRPGPVLSVLPLLQELFGLTDDTRGYVELSDGGHFENLGLYEMVMRRCRNILVVDSGADPTFHFEDLGNALRKIEIDLGIPITFHPAPNMRAGNHGMARSANRYCAVGTIHYSCVDGDIFQTAATNGSGTNSTAPDATTHTYPAPPSPLDGTLIYIKACLNGTGEPMDITEYSRSHPDFPHESTSNQFFNEAQFESHRSLGSHILHTVAGNTAGNTWADLITAASTHAQTTAPTK